ncbi:hypothetical protein BD309DRAFT_720904 [Dichomitus squalens]|nr:hypothetical protein BD309DRAFT_720904 [Dichomitus squalens]
MVCESWEILGQKWLFLAICDGHGGPVTADCVTRKLPNGIRLALEDILENTLSNQLDWGNMEVAQPIIASMLSQMVEALNGLIGEAVRKLCRHPNALREEQARALVESEKYRERLLGAFNRSTLAAALVNVTHQFMWAVGIVRYAHIEGSSRILPSVDVPWSRRDGYHRA